MLFIQFLHILRFFFERGVCLVLPSSLEEGNELPLSELDLLKVKYFLAKYDVSPKDKALIYATPSLCRFILEEQMLRQQFMERIDRSIMNIQLRPNQSLNDFLQSLRSNDPIRKRIVQLMEEDCPICFEPKPTHCLPCHHLLCGTCCDLLHSSDQEDRCPICRVHFTMDSIKVKNLQVEAPLPNSKFQEEASLNAVKDNGTERTTGLKKLVLIPESDFSQFCGMRFQRLLTKSGGVLTSIETDELYWFIKYFQNDAIHLFSSTRISSEEVRCFVIAILYKEHNDITLCKYIDKPNRILRFLAVLLQQRDEKYGKPNPREKILLRGGRPFRSIILTMISQCEDTEVTREEFCRSEKKWKSVFKFVHFGEPKNREKYPIAFQYANSICNGKKIAKERIERAQKVTVSGHQWNGSKIISKWSSLTEPKVSKLPEGFVLYDVETTECMSTISGKVNKYFDTCDEDIFEYLQDKPGLAFRLMRRITLTFETSERLEPFLEVIIPKMNFDQQVDLFHVFSSSDPFYHPSVVVTLKSSLHWVEDTKK
jgi:hypothetical protein